MSTDGDQTSQCEEVSDDERLRATKSDNSNVDREDERKTQSDAEDPPSQDAPNNLQLTTSVESQKYVGNANPPQQAHPQQEPGQQDPPRDTVNCELCKGFNREQHGLVEWHQEVLYYQRCGLGQLSRDMENVGNNIMPGATWAKNTKQGEWHQRASEPDKLLRNRPRLL